MTVPLPLIFHPDYVSPLPEGHRFPMAKFGKVYEHLIRDGVAGLEQFHLPTPAPPSVIELAHSRPYVNAYTTGALTPREMRRIGLPWSAALVNRTCTAVGGTILAVELATQFGLACNTAGGTHHAHSNFGSGFCIFNDLAIAARWAQETGRADHVLIVDLDVHQGDGTASIFQHDPTVTTFSIHAASNFPFRKSRSDLDIGLNDGVEDDEYLQVLSARLPTLLDTHRPQLVLYDAGVDPHNEDKLGKLSLTDTGLLRRDYFVIEQCLQRDIPIATVVGGGYANDLDRLARRHCLLHKVATELYATYLG